MKLRRETVPVAILEGDLRGKDVRRGGPFRGPGGISMQAPDPEGAAPPHPQPFRESDPR